MGCKQRGQRGTHLGNISIRPADKFVAGVCESTSCSDSVFPRLLALVIIRIRVLRGDRAVVNAASGKESAMSVGAQHHQESPGIRVNEQQSSVASVGHHSRCPACGQPEHSGSTILRFDSARGEASWVRCQHCRVPSCWPLRRLSRSRTHNVHALGTTAVWRPAE